MQVLNFEKFVTRYGSSWAGEENRDDAILWVGTEDFSFTFCRKRNTIAKVQQNEVIYKIKYISVKNVRDYSEKIFFKIVLF